MTDKITKVILGISIILIAVVFGLLTISIKDDGITGNVVSESKKENIKIGVILPLSGNAAYYGEASQRGIELAKNQISEEFPKLNFEIIYEDSTYTAQGGVSAYTYLKNAYNLDAVITAASQVSLAVQPLAKQDNILQMAIFSSNEKYSSPNDLSFRTSNRNELEASETARFIKQQDYRKLGILYINNEFGEGFKESLKKEIIKTGADVEIIAEEAYNLGDVDFRTSLTKIKQKNPDAIFMAGLAANYAQILKQAHELNLRTQFLTMRSVEDPVLLKIAGDLAEGLIYTYPFDATSNNEEIEEFVEDFESNYRIIPDAYAAEGYEGLRITALAFDKCGKDYSCIQNYLTDLEEYNSVFGELSFDENGDVYYDFFMKIVKEGEFVPLQN